MPPCVTPNTMPTGSRCCSQRTRCGKAPAWAGLRGARRSEASSEGRRGFSRSQSITQPQWPDRGGRRHGPSAMVPVYALHGGRRKSGDVACRHRSRDLRAGGWSLDVPPQTLGAADECPVRDWLGQDTFRVTSVSADKLLDGSASPWVTLLEADRLQ